MLKTVNELFLNEYFLIEGILGNNLDDPKKLFFALGDLFKIKIDELNELFKAINNPMILDIKTHLDYMRHERIKAFYAMNHQPLIADDVNNLIQIKGSALKLEPDLSLKIIQDAPYSKVYQTLSESASRGEILGLQVMGILECLGIFVDLNLKKGIKKLTKAMKWCNVISALALTYFNPENQAEYLSYLYTLVKDTPYEDLYERVKTEQDPPLCKEMKLMHKLLNSQNKPKDVYDDKYAKIIYSKNISLKEKEAIAFSTNQDLVLLVNKLPINLVKPNYQEIVKLDEPTFVLNRQQETEQINLKIKNNDLRTLDNYHPLMLVSDCKYLMGKYQNYLKNRFEHTNFITINVNELTEADFESNPNNIFIQHLDEKSNNVCLIKITGEINETLLKAVKKFTQTSRRKNFKIATLGVTLNLKEVLPIILCDNHYRKYFEDDTDQIILENIKNDEKKLVIDDLINKYQTLYEVNNITFEKEIYEKLSFYHPDMIEQIISETILNFHNNQKFDKNLDQIILNYDDIKSFIQKCQKKDSKFGFGGIKNEYK